MPVCERLWLTGASHRHSAPAFQTQASGSLLLEFWSEFSTLLCPLFASHAGLGPPIPSVYSLSLSFLVSKAAASCLWAQACMPGSLPSLMYSSAPLLKECLYGPHAVAWFPEGPVLHTLPLSKNRSLSWSGLATSLQGLQQFQKKFLSESFPNGVWKIPSTLL